MPPTLLRSGASASYNSPKRCRHVVEVEHPQHHGPPLLADPSCLIASALLGQPSSQRSRKGERGKPRQPLHPSLPAAPRCAGSTNSLQDSAPRPRLKAKRPQVPPPIRGPIATRDAFARVRLYRPIYYLLYFFFFFFFNIYYLQPARTHYRNTRPSAQPAASSSATFTPHTGPARTAPRPSSRRPPARRSSRSWRICAGTRLRRRQPCARGRWRSCAEPRARFPH